MEKFLSERERQLLQWLEGNSYHYKKKNGLTIHTPDRSCCNGRKAHPLDRFEFYKAWRMRDEFKMNFALWHMNYEVEISNSYTKTQSPKT